jgi:hypothetical protein
MSGDAGSALTKSPFSTAVDSAGEQDDRELAAFENAHPGVEQRRAELGHVLLVVALVDGVAELCGFEPSDRLSYRCRSILSPALSSPSPVL